MRKICRICLVRKMKKFFSKDQSQEDGLSTQCKQCCSDYRKQLRTIHKQKALEKRCERIESSKDFFVSFE